MISVQGTPLASQMSQKGESLWGVVTVCNKFLMFFLQDCWFWFRWKALKGFIAFCEIRVSEYQGNGTRLEAVQTSRCGPHTWYRELLLTGTALPPQPFAWTRQRTPTHPRRSTDCQAGLDG